MAGYTGQYDCKVDAKGRLKLPAGLLRQLPEGHSGKFVINKGLDNNLDLYTLEDWDKVVQKLDKLNKFNSSHRNFLRAFYKNVAQIEMDSSERILISKKAADLIGLKDEAVIMCYGQTIEIWSKEEYDKTVEAANEDFSGLADEIFGNINWTE